MMQTPDDRYLDDNKLLSAFVQADSKATSKMYEKYLPMVVKYICRNNGSYEDARDVFQEALMALYKQAQGKQFVLTVSLKTYIFSICRYQWLKVLRKNKKVESLEEDFDLQDIDSNINSHLERAEQFLLLHNHISKFSGNNRKILELHFQKYSTGEIATQLGLSKSYVKRKKFECKKQLIESIKLDIRYKDIMQI